MLNTNIIEYAMNQLDLGEVEAQVYLAYLENKNPNLSKLSKEISSHRTQIYRAIEKLKENGLITEENGQFKIEPPEKLAAILKQKEAQNRLAAKQIDNYLSELNTKYYSQYEKPEYKSYVGHRQFVDIHNQVLSEITTDYCYFGNVDMFFEVFDLEYQEFWTKKRVEKNILSKLLIFESEKHKQFSKRIQAPNTEIRILPEKFRNMGSFSLYNKKVLCWDPALPRVIKLENEVMFTTFSQIFELLWEFCE